MWYICNPSGSAHTVCDDGYRITVRRFPNPRRSPNWIVVVDGVMAKSFGSSETRDDAMKKVERWLQLRNPEA